MLLVKDDDKRLISAADNADFFWFRSSLAILQRTTNLWLLWRQIPTLLMIFTTIVINKWIQVQSQHGNTVAIFSATLVSRMPYRAADMLFTDNRARKIWKWIRTLSRQFLQHPTYPNYPTSARHQLIRHLYPIATIPCPHHMSDPPVRQRHPVRLLVVLLLLEILHSPSSI